MLLRHPPFAFFFSANSLSRFSSQIGAVAVALLWMKLFPTLRDVERLEPSVN
jgi:hypothetical protein